MNYIIFPSEKSIDLSGTQHSISVDTPQHWHTIQRQRNKKAISCIYFNLFDIPLAQLKMRRKSCHCSECGTQSSYQFKYMNMPGLQRKKKQFHRQDSIRKNRFQIAGTTIKTINKAMHSFIGERKLTTIKLSTQIRTPSPSLMLGSTKLIDFKPVQLQSSLPPGSNKLPKIQPLSTTNVSTKNKQQMHIKVKSYGNDFIINVNQVDTNNEYKSNSPKVRQAQQTQQFNHKNTINQKHKNCKSIYSVYLNTLSFSNKNLISNNSSKATTLRRTQFQKQL